MHIQKILLSLIFAISFINLSAYEKPHYVDDAVWEEVAPALLPDSHPAKKTLDKLFSEPGMVYNLRTLRLLGFLCPPLSKPNRTVTAKHPKLKGYLVKIKMHEQSISSEWKNWLKRIHGAELISSTIKEKGYEHIFKVPKKWIYPLPWKNSKHKGLPWKNFILVVEDMKLVDPRKNRKLWKSDSITQEQIDALYDVFQTLGLFDSVYPDNVPFSKDGRIAFVDTEHYQHWPVRYDIFDQFLSETNRSYWVSLRQN